MLEFKLPLIATNKTVTGEVLQQTDLKKAKLTLRHCG